MQERSCAKWKKVAATAIAATLLERAFVEMCVGEEEESWLGRQGQTSVVSMCLMRRIAQFNVRGHFFLKSW